MNFSQNLTHFSFIPFLWNKCWYQAIDSDMRAIRGQFAWYTQTLGINSCLPLGIYVGLGVYARLYPRVWVYPKNRVLLTQTESQAHLFNPLRCVLRLVYKVLYIISTTSTVHHLGPYSWIQTNLDKLFCRVPNPGSLGQRYNFPYQSTSHYCKNELLYMCVDDKSKLTIAWQRLNQRQSQIDKILFLLWLSLTNPSQMLIVTHIL